MFGETGPKFGGARLPNDQGVPQKPIVDEAVICDRKRHVCRAVDAASAASIGPSFSIIARNSDLTAVQLSSQRLGAFVGFDQVQRQHPSRASGKPGSRSGASPYQDLTITKTFVTYFKFPIVPL
jgi:hypothetical protein